MCVAVSIVPPVLLQSFPVEAELYRDVSAVFRAVCIVWLIGVPILEAVSKSPLGGRPSPLALFVGVGRANPELVLRIAPPFCSNLVIDGFTLRLAVDLHHDAVEGKALVARLLPSHRGGQEEIAAL